MASEKKGKNMIDYSKGKIYKIVCNTTGLIYIGSTVQDYLCNRLAGHKQKYKRYLKGKNHFVTSFDIIKNDNYKIILIENYPCNSKEELHREERKYIETIKCVNKYIPSRTKTEYRKTESFKNNYLEWRKKNKDNIIEKKKIKIICEFCKLPTPKDHYRRHQQSNKCKKFQL